MPRPGAQQHKTWVGFEGPQESHSRPPSECEPGGGYGHPTKLSGKKKGREYNCLSQNYMDPLNSGISALCLSGAKREDSVWAELGRGSQVSVLWQDACPWNTGFGHQCKVTISMEQGPVPPTLKGFL